MAEAVRDEWEIIDVADDVNIYRVEPRILALVPAMGMTETEESARQTTRRVARIAVEEGLSQSAFVLMDRVSGQEAGARRVWLREADPSYFHAAALVGSSPLGRAISSFFVGMRRPRMSTCFLADVPKAIAWLHEMQRIHGRRFAA